MLRNMYKAVIMENNPKYICLYSEKCRNLGTECEHQIEHKKQTMTVYCKHSNKNIVLDRCRPPGHSYLTFNPKDF